VCKFKPFNKHVLVKKIAEAKNADLSPVLIPEEAKIGNKERYGLVKFVCAASDCERFLKDLNPDQPAWSTQRGTMDDVFTTSARNNGQASLIVDQTMIEEIKIEDYKFHIIHQNFIVGIIDE
jgi:hypothetical protein